MAAELERLRTVLTELDDVIWREHPDLHARLRPGLSDHELDLLAQTLLPYYLPAELDVLYRWHDGWDDSADGTHRSLLPDAAFGALSESIRLRRMLWDALGADGWHPLWFPAFVLQSGEVVALQLAPRHTAGQVFAYHNQADLSTSYDSVTTLLATALDLWRRGLLPDDRAYPEIRRIVAEHNPRSRTPDGVPRREISRSASRDWPAEWKQVLDIRELTPAGDSELATVAELASDPSGARPVRATLKGIGGSYDRLFATATDDTGAVTVFLMRDGTENFREASGGGRYDLWLSPMLDGPPLDQLGQTAHRFVEVGQRLYFVTRLVPV